jgi:hypothetical protein
LFLYGKVGIITVPISNINWQLCPMLAFRQPLPKKNSSILPDLWVLRNPYYITQSWNYFWILESFSKLLGSLKMNSKTVTYSHSSVDHISQWGHQPYTKHINIFIIFETTNYPISYLLLMN